MTNDDLIKQLYAIFAKQHQVIAKLAQMDPEDQYKEWLGGIDQQAEFENKQRNATDILDTLHDELDEPEAEHVPFDDNIHTHSVEEEIAMEDPFEDEPLHNDNTRKTFELPEERMFKHPEEDDDVFASLKRNIAKLAQMQDVEGFLQRALSTSLANSGGSQSQFHASMSKTPGTQQGNVVVGENYVLSATFTPPLPEPLKHKISTAFLAYTSRNPELAGKVSLLFT
jgi:hypothetical protein